ncbi:dihydroneopterin aldolase [Alphaproteobacteria bacterium 46_93_T64]|nr:dihydroneopterin aldolase [Alphaproteobacteria bacterium 46_93_T64]
MNTIDRNNVAPLPITDEAKATHRVFINDLLVDMLIGIYDHEKAKKQPVRLNISLTVLDHIGPIQDDYHNVVCYETIANAIKNLVKEEHINLVETLAEKVADICLENQRTISAVVKVEKLQAVSGAGSVGVEITRIRQ